MLKSDIGNYLEIIGSNKLSIVAQTQTATETVAFRGSWANLESIGTSQGSSLQIGPYR